MRCSNKIRGRNVAILVLALFLLFACSATVTQNDDQVQEVPTANGSCTYTGHIDKRYMVRDSEKCNTIKVACGEDEEQFYDECGCGCRMLYIPVSVNQLKEHPEKYDGRRVKVDGLHYWAMENSSFDDDVRLNEYNIWLDFSANPERISEPSYYGSMEGVVEAKVYGIFNARKSKKETGNYGHLGLWNHQIVAEKVRFRGIYTDHCDYYNQEDRTYVIRSPSHCMVNTFTCVGEQVAFFDSCGCGCESLQ